VKAVRLSALAIVYPGLTAIYFGQAAFLIKRPDQIGTLYYNAIPHPLFWPAFVSALLAAIVASQAIITGGLGTTSDFGPHPCMLCASSRREILCCSQIIVCEAPERLNPCSCLSFRAEVDGTQGICGAFCRHQH